VFVETFGTGERERAESFVRRYLLQPIYRRTPPGRSTGAEPAGSVYTEAARWRMKYKIALQKSDEGFSVSVPGLPGCWSQGATEAEAVENIQDAIRQYLSVRQAVERGIAAADAGKVVSHDEATRRLGL